LDYLFELLFFLSDEKVSGRSMKKSLIGSESWGGARRMLRCVLSRDRNGLHGG
jgi:hypothetical protein